MQFSADDLKKLKKNTKSSLKEMQEKLQNQNSFGDKKKDDRFWSCERDAAGNGSAVIRFLPKRPDDELPWVRVYRHTFEGPTGKWYIENSLSTLGQKDPVGEANAKLWATGIEANKSTVRKRSRKTDYIVNIVVLKDSKNPDNEGKVFLFKCNKPIFDMINSKVNPSFEDDEPIDVFDLWEGANFKLRITKDGEWASYEKSEFSPPSELFDGEDEEILKVMNSLHWLGEFIAPDKFKTYDELKKRLDVVLDESSGGTTAADDVLEQTQVSAPPKKAKVKESPAKNIPIKEVKDDDDDDDSFNVDLMKNIISDDDDSSLF